MLSNKSLQYLSENQIKLDQHILEKHNLNDKSTFSKRLIAFIVELAEFMNEQRDFKYWSTKSSSPKPVLLEEYIDGLHFLISIGNSLKVNFLTIDYSSLKVNRSESLTQLYLKCFNHFSRLIKKNTHSRYFKVLEAYLLLGCYLKFSEEEILDAYNKKNEINFLRQDNNY